jgi:hypothetical protein
MTRRDRRLGLSIIGKTDRAIEGFSTVRSRFWWGMGLVCEGDRLGRNRTCFLCWMLGFATLDPAYFYYGLQFQFYQLQNGLDLLFYFPSFPFVSLLAF